MIEAKQANTSTKKIAEIPSFFLGDMVSFHMKRIGRATRTKVANTFQAAGSTAKVYGLAHLPSMVGYQNFLIGLQLNMIARDMLV